MEMRKGPWKVEEDEVLIKHVKKYGARDWSSIPSKGLLRRTGKSCRLRWVNKLRPDLKTGVKFSAEEERSVIDLQAQFGNKWAKIATYLPGRTDNDVKNFWSSRQKRLARILHISSTPSLQAPKLSSSSHIDDKLGVPFSDYLVYPEQQPHLSFPQLKPDIPLLIQSQGFIHEHGGPSFIHHLEHCNGPASSFGPQEGTHQRHDSVDIDSLMYDLPPIDIFDHIEPPPSPSQWWL